MQLHIGQLRYYCSVCRRGFNSHTNYKTHVRSREGRKHHCEYYSKVYTNEVSLRYHLSHGSHRDWKTRKSWKNKKAFSSQGKVREFYSKYWKNRKELFWEIDKKISGKAEEICQPVIVKNPANMVPYFK